MLIIDPPYLVDRFSLAPVILLQTAGSFIMSVEIWPFSERASKSLQTLYQEWQWKLWYRSSRNRWDGSCMRCMCFVSIPNTQSKSAEVWINYRWKSMPKWTTGDWKRWWVTHSYQGPSPWGSYSLSMQQVDSTSSRWTWLVHLRHGFALNILILFNCAAIQQGSQSPVCTRHTSR